jgi:hypothetical protein
MADDEGIRQIAEAAQKLSNDQLRRLLEYLSTEYKDRLKHAEQRARLTLGPGDEVETTIPGKNLPAGSRGRVLHLARTRVHVDFGESGVWAVLASGLKKITSQSVSPSSPSADATVTR